MIVLVVGKDGTPRGPVSYALECVGFEARDVFTIEEADNSLQTQGASNCVAVIETQMLSERCGSETWISFFETRPELALVVTCLTRANHSTNWTVRARNVILLAEPFDAAAVVAAVHRAVRLSQTTLGTAGQQELRTAPERCGSRPEPFS